MQNRTRIFSPFAAPASRHLDYILEALQGVPVYLTLDLDVLDPSCFPGTGTPEPGGFSFQQLLHTLLPLQSLHIVGADMVELCPHLDNSDISTMTAITLLRELIMMMGTTHL